MENIEEIKIKTAELRQYADTLFGDLEKLIAEEREHKNGRISEMEGQNTELNEKIQKLNKKLSDINRICEEVE